MRSELPQHIQDRLNTKRDERRVGNAPSESGTN